MQQLIPESVTALGGMEVPVVVEGEAPPQPQVIYIVQAPKQKVDIKENYAVRAATILGILHILCGVTAFTGSYQMERLRRMVNHWRSLSNSNTDLDFINS